MPKNFTSNSTSAEGKQGPQGDIGPQGPQGVPGPAGPVGEKGDNIVSHPSGGVLLKPLTTTERVNIKDPPVGLMVFDSTLNKVFVNGSSGWYAVGTNQRRNTTAP